MPPHDVCAHVVTRSWAVALFDGSRAKRALEPGPAGWDLP